MRKNTSKPHRSSTTRLEVEKLTTAKKDNLILNVDGCIGICFVDMLRNEMSKEESDEYVKMGALNGLVRSGQNHWHDGAFP